MRAIKGFFVLAVIVAILAGAATIGLRVARGKPSGVEEVKPGIVAVSSVSINAWYMVSAAPSQPY